MRRTLSIRYRTRVHLRILNISIECFGVSIRNPQAHVPTLTDNDLPAFDHRDVEGRAGSNCREDPAVNKVVEIYSFC